MLAADGGPGQATEETTTSAARDPAPALAGLGDHLLLDRLGDGVVATDDGNRIVYCNPAAGQLLGWAPEDLTGQPLLTIVPPSLREAHLAGLAQYLVEREPRIIGRPVRVPALHADGSEVDVELTVDAFGRPDGHELFVAVIRDLSLRAELERQRALTRYLRVTYELAARLGLSDEADSIADAAPLVLEAIASTLDWDVAALWMVEGDELVPVDVWSRPGHPERGFAALTRATRFARGRRLPGRSWVTGAPEWIFDVQEDDEFTRQPVAREEGLHTAFAFPITSGETVLGVVEFLSTERRTPDEELMATTATLGAQLGQFVERKRAEHDARFQAALLAAEYEATIDGVVALSPTGELLSWNSRFLELTGLTALDLAGVTRAEDLFARLFDLLADPETLVDAIADLTASPSEQRRWEVQLVDGRVVDVYTTPLRGPKGRSYGRAWYLRDVTAEKDKTERVAHLARTLQASLLPPHPPEVPGLEIAALYQPAGSGNEVGGDFYDVFATRGHRWAAVVGDVCGTGPEAAALTALARYTIRAAVMHARRPSGVLADLNEAVLRHDVGERFLTAVVAYLHRTDSGLELQLASGGHPLPLIVRHDGTLETAGEPGTVIGVVRRPDLSDAWASLSPGDSIVFYTDGVTEARQPGGMLGEDGLAALVGGTRWESAGALASAIVDHVLALGKGEASDDVAVLVIRVPADPIAV